jgi:hypothetical protein
MNELYETICAIEEAFHCQERFGTVAAPMINNRMASIDTGKW